MASLRRLRMKLREREEVRQRNIRYKRDMAALAAGQRLAREPSTEPQDEDDEMGDLAVTSEVTGTLSKHALTFFSNSPVVSASGWPVCAMFW